MNVKVFYFTGTGNSLLLARMTASKIEGAELLPAVSLYGGTVKEVKADAVGFVFPVYAMDMPDIIREIIKNNDFSNVGYFFAAVTCGGTPGNTLASLNGELSKKGKKLNCGIEVRMGDNSIVYVTPKEKMEQRFKRLEGIASELAAAVNKREETCQKYEFTVNSVLMKHFINIALTIYYRIGRKSVIKEKCILCGLCAEVCPVRNIKITNENVEWGNNCKRCYACLNWCPQRAIRFGKIELKHNLQYRCPGICAADIIDQGKLQ